MSSSAVVKSDCARLSTGCHRSFGRKRGELQLCEHDESTRLLDAIQAEVGRNVAVTALGVSPLVEGSVMRGDPDLDQRLQVA